MHHMHRIGIRGTIALVVVLTACACAASQTLVARPSVPPASEAASPSPIGSGDPSVVATVRAYLDADAVHDYQKLMGLSDGTVHELWQWWEWRVGSCTCPAESLAIQRLRVQQEDAKHATVDVLARLGSGTTISGPMTLLRSGPAWIIHDYRRNSIGFASSIAPRTGHDAAGSLDVRLIGVDLPSRPTSDDGSEGWGFESLLAHLRTCQADAGSGRPSELDGSWVSRELAPFVSAP
jgi:hypothetical protein